MALMRSVENHATLVAGLLSPTAVGPLALGAAVGLVLAQDLIAPIDLPPFANSAMDGYAVRSQDIESLPVSLAVSQDIPAGRTDTAPLVPGTAARIMTGAPLPPGADVIVQVERTDGGMPTVRIDSAPVPGVHVRTIGEDVQRGALVLRAGTVIGPPQVGVAAALGIAELPVRLPLRVLVISTGSELIEPGRPLGPGQIYESNAPMLAAAISAVGGVAHIEHFVADNVDQLRAVLSGAAADIDLIITSGGVSAGAYEVVKDALAGEVEFAKVAMQPGMPQGAGRFVTTHGRSVPIVTLPGNPVSSYVSFEVFLRPAIRAAMGHPDITRPVVRAPLTADITSPAGKRQFRRGHLDAVAGTVEPWGGPGSHLLSWLAGADCMIVIDEDTTTLAAGDEVEIWLLG
jgi:molybdopterin molybdotransferase